MKDIGRPRVLPPWEAEEIKKRWDERPTLKSLATEFRCSVSVIARITAGKYKGKKVAA